MAGQVVWGAPVHGIWRAPVAASSWLPRLVPGAAAIGRHLFRGPALCPRCSYSLHHTTREGEWERELVQARTRGSRADERGAICRGERVCRPQQGRRLSNFRTVCVSAIFPSQELHLLHDFGIPRLNPLGARQPHTLTLPAEQHARHSERPYSSGAAAHPRRIRPSVEKGDHDTLSTFLPAAPAWMPAHGHALSLHGCGARRGSARRTVGGYLEGCWAKGRPRCACRSAAWSAKSVRRREASR